MVLKIVAFLIKNNRKITWSWIDLESVVLIEKLRRLLVFNDNQGLKRNPLKKNR